MDAGKSAVRTTRYTAVDRAGCGGVFLVLYECHVDAWDFTRRQRGIAGQLLHGRSPKQISQSLGLSVQTVYWHVENMYRRADVHSLGEFFAWATEHRECCEIERIWSVRDVF